MKAVARALRVLLALLVAATFAAPPAAAHGTSDAHLALSRDGARIDLRWDIALRDLAAIVELDTDADGTIAAHEWRAAQPAIASRALAAIDLARDGERCTPGPVAHALARRDDTTFAVLRVAFSCGGPVERIDVGYRLMAGVDTTHRAIVDAGDGVPRALRPGDAPVALALDARGGLDASFASFVVEGVHHILGGPDHLAFVLALVLAAVAVAAGSGATLRATLVPLVGIVTLFTVAHSVTLAGTALGWLEAPSRWVESAIAASVAFAGIQAWRARRDGRAGHSPAWLVFAFGLVHGFGFGASLLDAGFEGRPALAALLGFNLGVELGQLGVLAIAFPAMWALRHARAWRSVGHPALAATIVVAGLAWFVQRALDIEVDPAALLAAVR